MSEPVCNAVFPTIWAVVDISGGTEPKSYPTFQKACDVAFDLARNVPGEYHILESTFVVSSPTRDAQ